MIVWVGAVAAAWERVREYRPSIEDFMASGKMANQMKTTAMAMPAKWAMKALTSSPLALSSAVAAKHRAHRARGSADRALPE